MKEEKRTEARWPEPRPWTKPGGSWHEEPEEKHTTRQTGLSSSHFIDEIRQSGWAWRLIYKQ